MQHINWDNLRYVLTVATRGSIASAARELGVNRTTVLRRINGFQEDLNCRIFERGESGYVLTPEAEKIIAAAREVEVTLFNMERQIAGHELRLEGELRVTTTDSFMFSLLGPHLASFLEKHPYIVVDVLVTNDILDLNRRDADIAIRPTQLPEPHLVGHRIADVEFAIYASPNYLETGDAPDFNAQRWIGFADSLSSSPLGHWLDATVDPESICLRCDSFVAVRAAAEAGIGLALMPRLLGDASPLLEPLDWSTGELTTGLWIIAHPDLVRSARVQALIDHFTEALAAPADA